MRITQLQFERLRAARARDGLSIQEHVRRALDFYLGKAEKDHQKTQPGDFPPAHPYPDGTTDKLPTGAEAITPAQATTIPVPRPPARSNAVRPRAAAPRVRNR